MARTGAAQFGAMTERSVRLGITGFRRSGKTVFLTSLVHNLLSERRNLPFLDVVAEDRLVAARLQPPRDPTVPRSDHERHMVAMTAVAQTWPDSTRALRQLRLGMRLQTQGFPRTRLRDRKRPEQCNGG